MSREFALVLTAAGKSQRFSQGGEKKEYLKLGGETIIRLSLNPFLLCPELKRVVITVPKGQEDEMRLALGDLPSYIPVDFIEGGETRSESISHAIHFLSSKTGFSLIAIHDGARPFVGKDLIEKCLEGAERYGGAIPGLKIPDAVKRVGEYGMVAETVDRTGLCRIQTPQIFQREGIEAAYASLKIGESFDDDASLFISRGGKVVVTEGSEENRKITWKSDIKENRMRIGFGNDIHRLEEGRKLFIGGVQLPYSKGEVAHSDGDVLIHAIIDAILGAKGKGDIGTFFPPEDNKWKDSDSKILLGKILEITSPSIINLDATITLEGFKLNPHINRIRESLSLLLSIPQERISVKAKTNEGLDALGRGEAIKAEVVVLLD